MIIIENDHVKITELEARLSKEFKMKNLGGLKYFLVIKVSHNNEGIFLSQRKYVLDLLVEVEMLDCKPADTPMVQNLKLHVDKNETPENKERYQRSVGKLIYLSHTRPDITYAVRASVLIFMFCALGLVFDGTEGVRSRFHI
jgi:Reverse transcriptase (RNA-dependent DNA polymerase)